MADTSFKAWTILKHIYELNKHNKEEGSIEPTGRSWSDYEFNHDGTAIARDPPPLSHGFVTIMVAGHRAALITFKELVPSLLK